MLVKILLVILIAGLTSRNSAVAQEVPIVLDEPVRKEVIVEQVYSYQVQQYTRPILIQKNTPVPTAKLSAEAASIARFAAIMNGDYDAFLASWTAEAKSDHLESNLKDGNGPDFWKALWQKAFHNARIELTHRISTGEYIIIGYLVRDVVNQSVRLESSVVFKKVGQAWLATQELKSDPVFIFWRRGGAPVRQLIR
jgi:hypothetical protein